MTKKYEHAEIVEKLKALPNWALEGDFIAKTFGFKDFCEASFLLSRVALCSEQIAHHPDWSGG